MIHIGIIGLGWMGRLHAGYLKDIDDCAVCAVCDKNEEAAREVAAEYHARAYTDHRDLLKDPEVDTVYIVTPQMFHYEDVYKRQG